MAQVNLHYSFNDILGMPSTDDRGAKKVVLVLKDMETAYEPGRRQPIYGPAVVTYWITAMGWTYDIDYLS